MSSSKKSVFFFPAYSRVEATAPLSLLAIATPLLRAGLHQMCQGLESASPKVLKLMNKDFQDLDSVHQAAERVVTRRSLISGQPLSHRIETVG